MMKKTLAAFVTAAFLAGAPALAKDIPAIAKDPENRWYGVYTNYNAPAYNTNLVKKTDRPKTYEDFLKHPEWKGRVANRIFLGEVIDYIIGVGEHEIRVRAKPE